MPTTDAAPADNANGDPADEGAITTEGQGPTRLPNDHPLVTAFASQKAELAEAKKRLKDIDDAAKTEAQKQAETLAELQQENAKLKVEALRAQVAGAKGVPPDLISGSTKEELEASADALIAYRGGTAPQPAPNLRPKGPVADVRSTEETREDRRKRLAEKLER